MQPPPTGCPRRPRRRRRRAQAVPPDKTCGDGLTPRAVHQLHEMGLGDQLERYPPLRRPPRRRPRPHASRCAGPNTPCTRRTATWCGAATSTRSSQPTPSTAGATLRQGTEAGAPRVRRNGRSWVRRSRTRSTGSRTRSGPRYVVVADGSNSRFGRALGCAAQQVVPAGHGDPHLLREPAARRPVDRVVARRAGPQRPLAARATGGSSPSATAPSTSASGCSRRSVTSSPSTRHTS